MPGEAGGECRCVGVRVGRSVCSGEAGGECRCVGVRVGRGGVCVVGKLEGSAGVWG